MDAGVVPALARLRKEGMLCTVTSCFPSVTGPAYVPFLLGRFPGAIGLPGIRWFDRSRRRCTGPGHSRSYTGYQLGRLDGDLDPTAPTIYELVDRSVGALSVINRGLGNRAHLGRIWGLRAARAVTLHLTGNVSGTLTVDREVGAAIRGYLRRERPDFAFAGFGGMDKCSHAYGHESTQVREALRTVDRAAADIRADAEADGRWGSMHLWVTSDHGHAPVHAHDELAASVAACGYRVLAHPFTFRRDPEVAVMVSGNAMAHLYVELENRNRPLWPAIEHRWTALVDALLTRPSVDLAILPTADGAIVRSASQGRAVVARKGDSYSYIRETGDPLRVGRDLRCAASDDTHAATLDSQYPDSIVQIASLATAARSGEIILSAAPGWDFRARYEPINHVSTHGALHRDHMVVPLLMNRAPADGHTPRRTVDVMPSALTVLGKPSPAGLDGRSFMTRFPS